MINISVLTDFSCNFLCSGYCCFSGQQWWACVTSACQVCLSISAHQSQNTYPTELSYCTVPVWDLKLTVLSDPQMPTLYKAICLPTLVPTRMDEEQLPSTVGTWHKGYSHPLTMSVSILDCFTPTLCLSPLSNSLFLYSETDRQKSMV
jgi:hypothetical protein